MQFRHIRWRLRQATRWLWFPLFLLSLAYVLAGTLPPEPRWVLREELNTIGYAGDGRFLLTARRLPNLNPHGGLNRSAGPVQIRDGGAGDVRATLFPDAAEVRGFGAASLLEASELINVQPGAGEPWELHLVDMVDFTSRRVDFSLRPGFAHEIYPAPNAPFAAVLETAGGDMWEYSEMHMTLIELPSGRVFGRWNESNRGIRRRAEPIWHGDAFFDAQLGTSDGGVLYFWDAKKQVLRTEHGFERVTVNPKRGFALSEEELSDDNQRVKLWEIGTGTVVADCVVPNLRVHPSDDGVHAILYDRDEVRELWNLRERRKIGAAPPDMFEVYPANGKAIAINAGRRTVQAFDAETLQPLWSRTWPEEPPWHAPATIHGKDLLLALGAIVEVIDPNTGESLHQFPIVHPPRKNVPSGNNGTAYHVRDDGLVTVFFWIDDGGIEPDFWRRRLVDLREWAGYPKNSLPFVVNAIIDPTEGKLLLRTEHRADINDHVTWLSDDARTFIITYTGADDQRTIECWDIPAAKPWRLVIGIPLGVGLAAWFGRWLWNRRRGRADNTATEVAG